MELISLVSTGSAGIVRKQANRDPCLVPVCTRCRRIGFYCKHTDVSTFISARIPYNTLMLCEYLMVAHGKMLEFKLDSIDKSRKL